MVSTKKPQTDVESQLAVALAEIGEISPWWSDDDQLYVFEHAAYPWVDYAASTVEQVRENYVRVLRQFIEERLAGKIAEVTDRTTPGRGGIRPGAGRPKGSRKDPTERIRVPVHVAHWIKAHPDAWQEIIKKQMG